MKPYSFITALLIFAALHAANAYGIDNPIPCDKLYSSLPIEEGTRDLKAEKLDPDHRYHYLGSGVNGTVHRISSLNSSRAPWIRKVYNAHTIALNDMIGFEDLQKIAEKSKKFRVVKVERLIAPMNGRPTFMMLEDVKGTDLAAIWDNKNIPEELKLDLKKRYREIVDVVEKEITQTKDVNSIYRMRVSSGVDNLILELKNENIPLQNNLQHIIIKPDNILLEADTRELVLIDPF